MPRVASPKSGPQERGKVSSFIHSFIHFHSLEQELKNSLRRKRTQPSHHPKADS